MDAACSWYRYYGGMLTVPGDAAQRISYGQQQVTAPLRYATGTGRCMLDGT